MRRFISWCSIHTDFGSGSWAVIDDTLTVRCANGTKSVQLGDSSPASMAQILLRELATERPEDAA